jgi:hypothetical protein
MNTKNEKGKVKKKQANKLKNMPEVMQPEQFSYKDE